ncbi:hypothetical protein FRC17_009472 [Serendipita sp. 399]|nr:hypothetical protein FRC17_009472 [Serendipita sp. 399]
MPILSLRGNTHSPRQSFIPGRPSQPSPHRAGHGIPPRPRYSEGDVPREWEHRARYPENIDLLHNLMQGTIEDPVKSARRTPGQQSEIASSSRLPPVSGSGKAGTETASDETKHPVGNIPSSTKGSGDGPSIASPPKVDNGPSKSIDESTSGLEDESVSDTDTATDVRAHNHCWSWLSNKQGEDIFSRLLRKRGFKHESDDEENVEAKVNKRLKPSPLEEALPLDLSSPLNFDYSTGTKSPYHSFDDWLKHWESDINKSEIIDDSLGQLLYDLYTHDCGKPQEYKAQFDAGSDLKAREMAQAEILKTPVTAPDVKSGQFQRWIEEVLPVQDHTPLPVPDQDLSVNPTAVHVPRAFHTPPPAQTQRQCAAPAPSRPTSGRHIAPAAATALVSLPTLAATIAATSTAAPIPAMTSAPLVHPTPVPVTVAPSSAPVAVVHHLSVFNAPPQGRIVGRNENPKTTGKLPSWAKEVFYTDCDSDLTQWVRGREAMLRQPNAVGMTTAEEQWVLSKLYGPAREDLTPQQKRVSAEKRACEALPDSEKPILLDDANEVKSFTNKDRDFVLVCRASFTLDDRTFSYQTSICGQNFSSHDIALRHVKEQHLDGGRKKKR